MPKSESFVRIPTRCDLDCLALTSRFELFSFRHQNKNEKSNKSDNIGELQKKRLKKQTGGRIVSGEALHLNEENQASKNPQAELKDKTSHGCSCHGDRLIEPVNSPEKVLKLNEPTKCRNEFRMAGKKDSSAFHKRIRINRKLVSLFECVIVITWFSLAAAQKRILSLNGAEWTFQNSNQSIKGIAEVPGNIFRDLARNKIISSNLYGPNQDQLNRWIGLENWTYSSNFELHKDDSDLQSVILVAFGLDTIAELRINGIMVATSRNMFTSLQVDITQQVKAGTNRIDVLFMSPVQYSKFKSDQYTNITQYVVPPTCSHAIQNGECHVNFIRKMQCSFSWDWGPTFASSGIIRDMQLFIGNDVNIQHVLVYPTRLNQLDSPDDRPFHRWRLNVRVILDPVTVDRLSFRVKFLLNNVTLAPSSNDPIIINSQQSNRAETVIEFELITSKDHRLLPWFPNGFDYLESDPTYFAPNLHQLTVQLIDPDRPKRVISSKIIRIGLRELDLQQVALKNGYSFYFRVQKTPVYMRGTNYIPSTMSIGHIQLESARIRRLMIEAKSAQINMIRVWGGGIYDLDLLYELADEYGILIWQDMMFAVALYPVDDQMLDSVRTEIKEQIWRLQHHASIAVWAGNNENEVSIAQHWWPEVFLYQKRLKLDYMHLYLNTIGPIIQYWDPSREFVQSSPSNGRGTEHLGLFQNPQNPLYGDVHFYDYSPDCFNDKKYPNARFVSEFGYQAYPSLATLSDALPPSDLVWPITSALRYRQHAPDGNQKLIDQIEHNFDWNSTSRPHEVSPETQLAEFVYLTQVVQATAIKLETEFYLRNREPDWWVKGGLPANATTIESLTMGSLYWQLNDVWQAPSWSSLELNGRYKLLHQQVIRFFRPVHVIPFVRSDQLGLSVINDCVGSNRFRVQLTVHRLTVETSRDLKAAWQIDLEVTVASFNVHTEWYSLSTLLNQADCNSKQVCALRVKFEVHSAENSGKHFDNYRTDSIQRATRLLRNQMKSGENYLLLDLPKNLILDNSKLIAKFTKKTSLTDSRYKYVYTINLTVDVPVLYVMFTFSNETDQIVGEFSDNGFILFEATKELYFFSNRSYDIDLLENRLLVHKYN